MDYNEQSSTNGYDAGWQHIDNGINGYTEYSDLTGGFESGNAVHTTMSRLKSLMYETVIARSFLFMVVALLITAFSAYTAPLYLLKWLLSGYYNIYILFGGELAVVLISNWAIAKNNTILTACLFTVYSYLNGATIGIILLAYTGTSVAAVFLMCSGMFAVMAVIGLVTQKDLSSMGNLMLMGLIGIIIAGLVNIFLLHSSGMDLLISVIGILIFVGLTAYDTQKIKESVRYATTDNINTLALAGAFELYLDFINLFLKLLRLFGKKK